MNIKDVSGHIKKADKSVNFIIGAGASVRAGIPLAGALTQKVLKDYAHCTGDLSEEDRKSYGKVMVALTPDERKELIEELLGAAKLNWGHIALACLMKQKNVKRILSFNFDLILERAVTLLGDQYPVYDFATTPSKEISRFADKAIFHLHGQSYGLRLLNTEEETAEHKEALTPLIRDSICNNQLTIVIGYSGEADSGYEIIKENFDSHNRLIWLGYEQEPPGHLTGLLERSYAHYIGGCDFDLTMIEIARNLDCWPPEIFSNPPQHVLNQIQELPDYPASKNEGIDLLTLTRQELKKDAKEWAREKTDEQKTVDNFLAKGTNISDVHAWKKNNEGVTLSKEAQALSGKEKIDKLREAGTKYQEALAIKPDYHEALSNWGNALSEEAETLSGKEKIDKLREAGTKYQEALAIKLDLHEALTNWGNALGKEAETLSGQEKRDKLREASKKYQAALAIKPDYHDALYNWGTALGKEAKTLSGQEKQDKLREAGTKYQAALAIKPDLHEALANWGTALIWEAETLSGQEKRDKLREAEETLLKAKAITDKANYNLACTYTLQGRIDKALGELEACKRDGTLPSREHILEDEDLKVLHNEPKFQKLLDERG